MVFKRLFRFKDESSRYSDDPQKIPHNGLDLYSALVKISPDAIVLTDAHLKVRMANSQALKLYGYEKLEEVTGRHGLQFFAPKERIRAIKNIQRTFRDGQTRDLPYQLVRKDGSTFIGEISASAITDKSGKSAFILAVIRDVTERKAAEEKVMIAAKNYHNIFNSASDAIFVHDPKTGKIIDVNDRMIELYGFTREEAVTLSVADISANKPPYTQKEVELWLRRAIKEGPQVFEWLAKDRWGKEFWVEVNLKYVTGGDEKRILAVVRDISQRKKAQETLRERDKFLSTVFDSIQDGISVLDTGLNIVRVNEAMKRWYAHALPLEGKKCYEAYHGRKKACSRCPTLKALRTNKLEMYEVPLTQPDGITGTLELYAFPIVDNQGRSRGVVEYVRNISQRKRIEEERELLNRQLVKSNKRLHRLSLIDSQTRLYNHRYFEEVLIREFYRAKRSHHPLSIIMIDLDYFKSINDVYGHQFGDLVLRQFARVLKKKVRRYDSAVRFGGEEFIIISPGTDRVTALKLVQRIFDHIHLYDFGNHKIKVKLKLSSAIVSYPEDGAFEPMDLFKSVDRILNKVKEDGGNRIYTSGDLYTDRRLNLSGQVNAFNDISFLQEKINRLNKRANQSLIEAVFAFAKTIKVKDHYTGTHTENTEHYVAEIAHSLNLPKEEVECIKQAAILHDLGKIGISEKILLKKSALTRKEYDEIKKHPNIAVDIIRPIQYLHDLIPSILHHHEWWDGTGYPHGLSGEDIPVGARIIAVADVYHALISDRAYRKAFSHQDALNIIREGAGTQFDPEIVDRFLQVIAKEENVLHG
ncbi:MAG: PAS domain S-box protein [Candidatus Omnitrophica bacterium]|nr:PAS domain S-box protein [Candidatus Omnitrophota bacterium]